MTNETQNALDLLVEEIDERGARPVLEQILSLGGSDIEAAVKLLSDLTQA